VSERKNRRKRVAYPGLGLCPNIITNTTPWLATRRLSEEKPHGPREW
jgi:hypothetical protein